MLYLDKGLYKHSGWSPRRPRDKPHPSNGAALQLETGTNPNSHFSMIELDYLCFSEIQKLSLQINWNRSPTASFVRSLDKIHRRSRAVAASAGSELTRSDVKQRLGRPMQRGLVEGGGGEESGAIKVADKTPQLRFCSRARWRRGLEFNQRGETTAARKGRKNETSCARSPPGC